MITVKVKGLTETLRRIEEYKIGVQRKANELARRLAEMGATNVSLMFARAIYDGQNDFTVTVEDVPTGGYKIVVNGESVAFVEFGAGVTYGYGHPQAAEFGVGPGTYPDGKGHWNDPKGWWIPKDKGGGHTYGNPPNMPMYNTAADLRNEIERVAREVFST